MARSAARRYAEAVVSLAKERGNFEAWDRDLAQLADLLRVPEVARFLTNPAVPVERKRAVLASVLDDALPETRNLVNLLLDRQRVKILPELYDVFTEAWLAERGIARAEVTTSEPLSPEGQRAVKERLQQIVGKEIQLSLTVDPDIIGGIVARVGDHLFDGSVRTKLRQLRARMLTASAPSS